MSLGLSPLGLTPLGISGQSAAIAGPAYTMSAGAGAFVLSAPPATLVARRAVRLSTGAFTVGATPVGLRVHRRLAVMASAIAITGSAAVLRARRIVQLGAGSLSILGQPAWLAARRRMAMSAGALTLSGGAVSFAVTGSGHRGTIEAGRASFAVGGSAASLRVTRRVAAASGAFDVGVSPARLVCHRRAVVQHAVLTLTGRNVLFRANFRLKVTAAAYAVAGGHLALRMGNEVEYTRAPLGGGYVSVLSAIQMRPEMGAVFREVHEERGIR